jgi:hypothetical protein
VELRPQPPEDIARRALLLQAIHLRGWMEDGIGEGGHIPMSRAIDRLVQINSWIDEHQLLEIAEPGEAEFLACRLGELDAEQVGAAYWRMDSLGVLTWALEHLPELPGFDSPFDAPAVMAQLPRVGEPCEEFLATQKRRTDDELARALEAARLWLWRATVYGKEEITSPGDLDWAARRAAELGTLDLIADGDFTVMATCYRGIESRQQELLQNLARERCQALSWLCGADIEDEEEGE